MVLVSASVAGLAAGQLTNIYESTWKSNRCTPCIRVDVGLVRYNSTLVCYGKCVCGCVSLYLEVSDSSTMCLFVSIRHLPSVIRHFISAKVYFQQALLPPTDFYSHTRLKCSYHTMCSILAVYLLCVSFYNITHTFSSSCSLSTIFSLFVHLFPLDIFFSIYFSHAQRNLLSLRHLWKQNE